MSLFNPQQLAALDEIEKLLRANFDATFLAVCSSDEHGIESVQCAATGGVMRVSGLLHEGRRVHDERIAMQNVQNFIALHHPPHEPPPPDPES